MQIRHSGCHGFSHATCHNDADDDNSDDEDDDDDDDEDDNGDYYVADIYNLRGSYTFRLVSNSQYLTENGFFSGLCLNMCLFPIR